MSIFIELTAVAVKAVSVARAASRVAGHESSVIEEAHSALTPARHELRTEELGSAAGTDPTAQSIEDNSDGGDGILETILDWLGGL